MARSRLSSYTIGSSFVHDRQFFSSCCSPVWITAHVRSRQLSECGRRSIPTSGFFPGDFVEIMECLPLPENPNTLSKHG